MSTFTEKSRPILPKDARPRKHRGATLVAFLLLCWSAVFWFKTGAPRLAIGTLVAATTRDAGREQPRR
jgi:hypothetical protein